MNVRHLSLFGTALLVVLLSAWPAPDQQEDRAAMALKAAIKTETVDGDLRSAIGQYKKIITLPGADRATVATALLRMGQCHEKLGDADIQEARKAYERVVREYGDQAAVADEARVKLAALNPAAGAQGKVERVERRIWSGPEANWMGNVSPDGRFLSFMHTPAGHLAVHDLATGDNRDLTDDAAGGYCLASVPSPDSRKIAYCWYDYNGAGDVRVIGLDGSKPRILCSGSAQQLCWSPDGEQLLVDFFESDGTRKMTLVSVDDGSKRVLKTMLVDMLPGPGVFSPGGRFVVWPAKEGFWTIELQTGRESLLFPDLGRHGILGWTPEGKRLMFSSERAGSNDIWLIAVEDGKAVGEPDLVKKSFNGGGMGFARAGAFYYGVRTPARDVYIAELDMESGALVTPPEPVSRRWVGVSGNPDWSPDGKSLAYNRSPTQDNNFPSFIVVRSTDTGEERDLHILGVKSIGLGLRWTPDGKNIVVPGMEIGKGMRLLRVDAQSGQATPLMPRPLGAFPRFDMSRDGKKVFYITKAFSPDAEQSQLMARDISSGLETEILRRPSLSGVSASPDGKQLVIAMDDEQGTALWLMPAAGGRTRELIRNRDKELNYRVLSWTPDGRRVIFSTTPTGSAPIQNVRMWSVAAEGGEPVRLDLGVNDPYNLRIHPDGRRVAIGTWTVTTEIWVMENFLPPGK